MARERNQLPLPFVDRPTSRSAAERIEHEVHRLRAIIWISLRDEGPATDEELQIRIGMSGDTERPRRGELLKLGMIEDTGTTRRTRSGREAIVWRIRQS